MKNFKSSDPCTICGESKDGFVVFHHVRTRGAGGSNESHNLMPVCYWHHVEVHNIGLVSFAKKHENARNFLIMNGWQFLSGKWIHERI